MEKLCKGAHRNVIEIFRHGRLRPDSAFYFIDMELCNINLDEYLHGAKMVSGLVDWKQGVDEGNIITLTCGIMDQIAAGLGFIHGHNEVHRDLSPQNGIAL
jgi:serine/threonine protein kinase